MSTRITIAALVLALGLIGCASPNPQPPGLTPIPSLAPGAQATLAPAMQTAPAPTSSAGATKPDATAGGQTFAQNCSPCHGARGEGGVGPALRGNKLIQSGNDQAVFTAIAKGRPGTAMPAWLQANGGKLTEAQINDVIAFLKTMQ